MSLRRTGTVWEGTVYAQTEEGAFAVLITSGPLELAYNAIALARARPRSPALRPLRRNRGGELLRRRLLIGR
jgi:hypothetical protein